MGNAPRRHGAGPALAPVGAVGMAWYPPGETPRVAGPAGCSPGTTFALLQPAMADPCLHVSVDTLLPLQPCGRRRGAVRLLLPAQWELAWGLPFTGLAAMATRPHWLLAPTPGPHSAATTPSPCPTGSRHGPGRPQACGNHGNEAPLGLRPHGNHGNHVPLPLPLGMAPSGRSAGPGVPWRAQAWALGGGHEASVAAARAAASAHGCRHNAPPASDCPFCLPAGRPAQNKAPRQRCCPRHGLAAVPGGPWWGHAAGVAPTQPSLRGPSGVPGDPPPVCKALPCWGAARAQGVPFPSPAAALEPGCCGGGQGWGWCWRSRGGHQEAELWGCTPKA